MTDVLLVTGGSRGIGAATAELAARRGYDVCLTYLDRPDAAADVVAACRALGREALAVRADVAVEADVVAAFDACEQAFGHPRVVVANAGIVGRQGRLEDATGERLERVVAVNVLGALLCAREAVRRMSTRRGGQGGAIVLVSSVAARLGSPGEYVDYAAAKAAVDTLALGLAREVAEDGLRVNAVRPGVITTGIHASGGEPDRVARVAQAVPMRRGGEAHEVAEAILWLASPEASYVTGALLDVSGGR